MTCEEVVKDHLSTKKKYYYPLTVLSLLPFLIKPLKTSLKIGLSVSIFCLIALVIISYFDDLEEEKVDNCEEYTSRMRVEPEEFKSVIDTKWEDVVFDTPPPAVPEDVVVDSSNNSSSSTAVATVDTNEKDAIPTSSTLTTADKADEVSRPITVTTVTTGKCGAVAAKLNKQIESLTKGIKACISQKDKLLGIANKTDCGNTRSKVEESLEKKYSSKLKKCRELKSNAGSIAASGLSAEDARRIAAEEERRLQEQLQKKVDGNIEETIMKNRQLVSEKENQQKLLNDNIIKYQQEIDELNRQNDIERANLARKRRELEQLKDSLRRQLAAADAANKAAIRSKQSDLDARIAQLSREESAFQQRSNERLKSIEEKKMLQLQASISKKKLQEELDAANEKWNRPSKTNITSPVFGKIQYQTMPHQHHMNFENNWGENERKTERRSLFHIDKDSLVITLGDIDKAEDPNWKYIIPSHHSTETGKTVHRWGSPDGFIWKWNPYTRQIYTEKDGNKYCIMSRGNLLETRRPATDSGLIIAKCQKAGRMQAGNGPVLYQVDHHQFFDLEGWPSIQETQEKCETGIFSGKMCVKQL